MKKLLMTLTLAIGAAIAIPSIANAQSTTTTTQPTKECCKGNKACAKDEGKACAKEGKKECAKLKDGKACCKEGKATKKGMHKARPGKINKAERRMASGKLHRGSKNPMMKGISLSEEQQQKVKELREKHLAADKKAKADMKAKSKEESMKLRAEFDKEMEKILDKDQLKQYQANKAEMKAKKENNAEKKANRTDKKSK